MSAESLPISPSRFASALKDLSIEMLLLKFLEISNSMARLQTSNDQLRPFAEAPPSSSQRDEECVTALEENLVVIDRMTDRLAMIRAEVEDRGVAWADFRQSALDGSFNALAAARQRHHERQQVRQMHERVQLQVQEIRSHEVQQQLQDRLHRDQRQPDSAASPSAARNPEAPSSTTHVDAHPDMSNGWSSRDRERDEEDEDGGMHL